MTRPAVVGNRPEDPLGAETRDVWLPGLVTPDPQSGYDLAVALSRMAVKLAQPSAEVRERLRRTYDRDALALIHISAVVARNFQTVAAANDYWQQDRGPRPPR